MLQPLQQQAVKRIDNIRQNDNDIVGALCTHLPRHPIHLIAQLLNRPLDPLSPLFTYLSTVNDIGYRSYRYTCIHRHVFDCCHTCYPHFFSGIRFFICSTIVLSHFYFSTHHFAASGAASPCSLSVFPSTFSSVSMVPQSRPPSARISSIS